MIGRLAIAALVAASVASGSAAAACTAAAPVDLGSAQAKWLGACPGGRAEGLGVLRANAAAGPRLFFGRMKAGRPETGVVATASGDFIPAWRYDRALYRVEDPSGDRGSSVATFDVAAAAARVAAKRLRAAGNKASAAYYATRARDLERALE